MFLSALVSNSISISTAVAVGYPKPYSSRRRTRAALWQFQLGSGNLHQPRPAVLSDSLKLLEWDKVCDSVSSFAGTMLGRETTKKQLWSTEVSYEESKMLLAETAAAIQLIDYGAGMDFAGIDTVLVKSAIDRVSRGLPVNGIEVIAVVSLIQFAETMQITLKTAMKEDADWYNRFSPLTQVVIDFIISRSFVKSVKQVIDEDGSVKDNASSELKRSRDQVRDLERKLYQLMDRLIRNDKNEASSLEMCNNNGRMCIKTMVNQFTTFDGLLLSSGSGVGNLVEPIAAVSLNDELQQSRVLVAKAEDDVLSRLSDKMLAELDHIQNLLKGLVRLDVVTARAKYSIAYGGTFPDLSLPSDVRGVYANEADDSLDRTFNKGSFSHLPRSDWKLFMSKAYHPLLLQQHRESLHKARKDIADATAEIRRRRFQGKNMAKEDDMESHLSSVRHRVSELEIDHPVPVDFVVSMKTGVLVITGPNTGGKTISLKTVGLASLMAKTGLYVLAAEPVKIPWFDAIYADIGDEQSLTQSLSTFSGHLKQISAIRLQSTNKSLVLLDEVSITDEIQSILVGAGTNPLEGAALGMSLLECFAESDSLLTIATTHHGELKTLKYCNNAFENACVEFDEESLKPTYKILWGIPGRSNAINVAKKIGLPRAILDNALKLHGTSSAEINGVIIDMETSKQDFQRHLQESHHYLMLSRKLHEDLLIAKQNIEEYSATQRNRKAKAISDNAATARSILRNKLQQFRESAMTQKTSQKVAPDNSGHSIETLKQSSSTTIPVEQQSCESAITQKTSRKGAPDNIGHSIETIKTLKQSPSTNISVEQSGSSDTSKPAHEKRSRIPQIGEMVRVPSLGKEAMVLKVEESKGEILVQASNIKLRIKLRDIDARQVRAD